MVAVNRGGLDPECTQRPITRGDRAMPARSVQAMNGLKDEVRSNRSNPAIAR